MTQSQTQTPPAVAALAPAADHDTGGDVIIKCAGLSKTFRDFWLRNRVKAVENVNLQIRRGQVFGLLGPNGSGKSTTIKMILGLLHPTAGRVAVFGKHPEDVKTKTQIGYLPEESYLYPFLNARETLDYYARLFHLSRDQRRRRIEMLLEMVGLEQVARRPIGEYSKGMQRRIGLAQALINDPQLLILDEPTSGLDPIGTRQIKDLILALARRGKTILLCSHLLGDVEDVCDEVAIMFGGKVRTQGTVGELLLRDGATLIQTPELEVEVIEAIEALLTRYGKHIEKVDQPRQKLEQLFLDIVHKAQSEGALTSGARSGGKIAGFLVDEEQRGAHLPEAVEPAKVIEQLVAAGTKPQPTDAAQAKTSKTPPPSAPADESAAASPPPARPPVHEQVISQLTSPPVPKDKPAEPTTGQTPPSDPQADLSVIEKLVAPAAAADKPRASENQDAGERSAPGTAMTTNEDQQPPQAPTTGSSTGSSLEATREQAALPDVADEPVTPTPPTPEPRPAESGGIAEGAAPNTTTVDDQPTPPTPSPDPSAQAAAENPPPETETPIAPDPKRKSITGEKPDEGFINALMNVEPYVPSDDDKEETGSGPDDKKAHDDKDKPTQS